MVECDIVNKLPEQLRGSYKASCKNSVAVEELKVAAALKLWNDRGFRDIKFGVPMVYGKKTVFVKVLVKRADGTVIGVECAMTVRLKRLHARIELLKSCLPPDSYLIVVFPSMAGERVSKAVELVDEVWVTGADCKVEQMMFGSFFHME